MTRNFISEIKDNSPLDENHNLLTFSIPRGIDPKPGHFFMLGLSGIRRSDPLLRRPFCFFRKTRGGAQILYRVKGRGTSMLREMKKGEALSVLGPLGSSYPMPPKGKTPLIVAGGIGIASLFPLIEKLKGKAVVLYGARNKSELLMLKEVKALAGTLHTCTDDGSCGKKGMVTGLLKGINGGSHIIYACGPKAMLKAVALEAAKRCVSGYVSLEENMACGVGACLGCAVKTVLSGYERVCKEGPVFKMEDIEWQG